MILAVKIFRLVNEDGKRGTHHFTLLQLSDILLKNELPFGFNPSLLPDRMLLEQFVRSIECGIMEHARIAFQHIAKRRTEL